MATSNLSFQSAYGYQKNEVVTRQTIAISQSQANALQTNQEAADGNANQSSASVMAQAGQRLIQQQEVTFAATTEQTQMDDADQTISQIDQRFSKMISLIEKMFGIKIELYDGEAVQQSRDSANRAASAAENTAGASTRQQTLAVREYHQISEVESSSVAIQGRLELNDGRSLQLDFSLDMSRSRYEEYYGEVVLSGRNVDPLVVNLNGNAAQLTNQRQAFDLDADGIEEQIAFATGDSAFLAQDKNQNGTIDDGSELFGPNSGSGFSELAQYDDNQDGLIDSLDNIWQSLVLVQRDESGNEQLLSLKDVGISAFVLERTRSPFSLFNNEGERTGVIQETGLYVKEDGSVDSLQHVDLVI